MSSFKPKLPYNTAAKLMKPYYSKVKGVRKKNYCQLHEIPECDRINISFKTYGGTEQQVNNSYSIVDTANVETFFRPDIRSDCRIVLLDTKAEYEIIGEPENIDMKNQYLKFKVRRVKGGA